MDQKIFNNIILLIIIAFIIKQVSPEPDSILYVLQKYINYFGFQFKKILAKLKLTTIEDFQEIFNENIINKTFGGLTFNGITSFGNQAPSFKTSYEVAFVNFYKKKYPDLLEKDIFATYNFLQTLISTDTDQYFSTPSDHTPNSFTSDELNKIENIILKKLNRNNFNFSNFNFEYIPKYYLNFSGKEIDPFVFNIQSNIGNLRIYINIDIRNDVYQNKEYLVINEIKPLKDKQVIFTNQNNSIEVNYENRSAEPTNPSFNDMYDGNDYFYTNTYILDETNNKNIQNDFININNLKFDKVKVAAPSINNNIMYDGNDYLFNNIHVLNDTNNTNIQNDFINTDNIQINKVIVQTPRNENAMFSNENAMFSNQNAMFSNENIMYNLQDINVSDQPPSSNQNIMYNLQGINVSDQPPSSNLNIIYNFK